MAKSVAAFPAKCRYVTPVKEGQYGQYRSILFIHPPEANPPRDSDECKVWVSLKPSDDIFKRLRPGNIATLMPSGKSYDVLLHPTDGQSQNGNGNHVGNGSVGKKVHSQEEWSAERKLAIKQALEQRAKVLAYCHQVVSQLLSEREIDASQEIVQKYATTLYLDLKQMW